MHILINFSQLKSGGGQNVALNFLLGLESVDLKKRKISFLVASGSAPHKFLEKYGRYRYYVSPRNPILRMLFESTFLSLILKSNRIDVVYTYFGYSLILGRIKQISGSADSNLYFPEIDFWSQYRGIGRLKKKIIDTYRLWGIFSADAVIYENEMLLSRAKNLYKIKNVKYIRPSISPIASRDHFSMPLRVPNSAFKLLFLCGWQLNKNVMLIPQIATEARKKNINLHILLTAPDDGSIQHRKFCEKLIDLEVSDMVTVTGQVDKENVPDLYRQVDAVALLSRLESFSNNIIEAWYFNKPLIVSEEDWARSLCKEAAIYVQRDSANEIVNAVFALKVDNELKSGLINKGSSELKRYPTIECRISEELDYAEYILKNT